MMHTEDEYTSCIGSFTFSLIHPQQVFLNSTTIRSIGVVVKDQVLKCDHMSGYMTVRGTETLFSMKPFQANIHTSP